jgi:hypothetical protein
MSTHLLLFGAAGFISIGTFSLTDPLLPVIAPAATHTLRQ